ncbi:type II toxin-antitoxin system HicB family antitoxin [Megamonas hypermegale]|uniref:type II toxin-antitoxin system HicB family antitoxin n=1 Tax=Megamonas hypermegale TaxID=158847 RepID=UPI003209C147
MKLVYPAIFYPQEEQSGYTVEVPDLPGCVSCSSDIAEAIAMGADAASGWVLDEIEDNKPIPKASHIENIHPKDGGFVSLLVLDMDSYIQKYGTKSVRKNLTIPAWLNTFAEKNNLNISKVLQDALLQLYKKQAI